MDYETLEQVMNFPYLVPTAIAAATGVVGLLIGYVSGKTTGRNNVKLAEFQRDIEVAREATKKTEYETQRQQVLVSIDIRRLELANADEEHKGNLETMALKKQYQIEDEDRQRKFKQEDDTEKRKEAQETIERESALLKSHTEYRLQVAEKLAGLKPAVETYLQQLREAQQGQTISFDIEYEEKKQAYRTELIKEWSDSIDNKFDPDEDIPRDRADDIIAFVFPPRKTSYQQIPQMPEEIRELVRILNQ